MTTDAAPPPSDTAAAYRRDLGLLETVSIVISRIIGSGIFKTPAPIMALAGCTSLFGVVWVIGGIITIFSAVCYAELVALLPRSGGPYVYLKEAYHPRWAFLRGWAMFFVSETGSIAAVALVFAEYCNAVILLAGGVPLPRIAIIAIALLSIWFHTLVNCFGVALSGKLQNLFSSVKIIALLSIIGTSFASRGKLQHFSDPFLPDSLSLDTVFAVGAALRYSFFAFSGWEGATYVAEEVKNPGKNLPRSLFLGIGGVLVLYAGANAAYLYQMSPGQIGRSGTVAADAMTLAIGTAGGVMISIAIMLNTFGNVSTQILVKSRTWQAMAADGFFFRLFAPLHPRHGTPNHSLIAQGVWASVLLIFAAQSANAYERIIDFFSATGTIFNIMTIYSLHLLRKKYPNHPRPYRAWLYPWSMIITIAFFMIYLLITFITAFTASLMGIALTMTGLIYYYLVISKNNQTSGQ